MRKIKVIVLCLALTMVMSTVSAFGCTGLYIGKDVSADGSTIVGRSEEQEGFKVALPELTYKYTYVPDSSDLGDGQYPGTCTNEYGLVVVGTISASPSDAYLELDPYVHPGLREAILPGFLHVRLRQHVVLLRHLQN